MEYEEQLKEVSKTVPKKVMKTLESMGFMIGTVPFGYRTGACYFTFIDGIQYNFDFSFCRNIDDVMKIPLLKEVLHPHRLKPPEELAQWCVDNGATTFGYSTTDFETWYKFITGSQWAPTGMMINGEMKSGVEVMADKK